MRAAEAFWRGRAETFEFEIDQREPKCFDATPFMHAAMQVGGRFREGVAFRRKELEGFDKILPFKQLWKVSMELEVVSTEATVRATKSLEKLMESVGSFRGQVKNDLSSIKAASDRVQSEVVQMSERYRNAQSLLTSPDFERAIANAERMAAALEAISRLSETKLSVAVFSGGKAA